MTRCKTVTQGLDSNVSMPNDLPALKCLRSGVIGVCRVGERTGLEVGNLDLDVESGIGGNILTRLGRDNDGGYHICSGWDITHN